MTTIVRVIRDAATGKINGIYYGNPGIDRLEALPEDNPDVLAFLNPKPSFPVLQKWQLWLAALELEPPVYKTDVLQAVDALPGKTPQEKETIRIMIEDAQAYHREDPRMDLLGQAMGIPSAQMDDLWRWAATFQPGS